MVVFNRCQYETTKDSVSNLVSLINRYHPGGDMIPTVTGNRVHFSVISSASTDFYYILPKYEFIDNLYNLDKEQQCIKTIIENCFFSKLQQKNRDTFVQEKYNNISFDRLLHVAATLKFSTRIFPIHTEEIIYVGIGSKKLGYCIMTLYTNRVQDGICPKFDLNNGFIDPMDGRLNSYISNESISIASVYALLNSKFKKWKDSGSRGHILDLNKMNDLLTINENK